MLKWYCWCFRNPAITTSASYFICTIYEFSTKNPHGGNHYNHSPNFSDPSMKIPRDLASKQVRRGMLWDWPCVESTPDSRCSLGGNNKKSTVWLDETWKSNQLDKKRLNLWHFNWFFEWLWLKLTEFDEILDSWNVSTWWGFFSLLLPGRFRSHDLKMTFTTRENGSFWASVPKAILPTCKMHCHKTFT